jgi:alkyl hydroperoxide reductase subunit AhpF
MKKEFIFRMVLALGIFFLVYQFGIKPIVGDKISKSTQTTSDKSAEWVKSFVPSDGDGYDVIVYGEEPDGIAAAVSSARLGAKTLLLPQGKDLGGVVSHSMLTDLELPFGKGGSC